MVDARTLKVGDKLTVLGDRLKSKEGTIVSSHQQPNGATVTFLSYQSTNYCETRVKCKVLEDKPPGYWYFFESDLDLKLSIQLYPTIC